MIRFLVVTPVLALPLWPRKVRALSAVTSVAVGDALTIRTAPDGGPPSPVRLLQVGAAMIFARSFVEFSASARKIHPAPRAARVAGPKPPAYIRLTREPGRQT